MNKIMIAFDVDGTLRDNRVQDYVKANERIRTLLIILSTFKNTHIIVWSGGGELYARQCAAELGLKKYVDEYADKQIGSDVINCQQCREDPKHIHFMTDLKPDIAIDDMQEFSLGTFNLICREK